MKLLHMYGESCGPISPYSSFLVTLKRGKRIVVVKYAWNYDTEGTRTEHLNPEIKIVLGIENILPNTAHKVFGQNIGSCRNSASETLYVNKNGQIYAMGGMYTSISKEPILNITGREPLAPLVDRNTRNKVRAANENSDLVGLIEKWGTENS